MSAYVFGISQFCLFTALLGGVGCSREEIRIPEETLDQARKVSFDYVAALAAAQRCDSYAITQMMWFSLDTDAAGALGHGVVLIELLGEIGDETFSQVAKNHRFTVKRCVAEVLEGGAQFLQPPLRRPLQEMYPQTCRALGIAAQPPKPDPTPTSS